MHQSTNYGKKFARGLFRDPKKHEAFKAAAPRFSHVFPNLPPVFDLRAKTAPCEDQGQCGSCWAFSQTNALRSAYMLDGRDPGPVSKNFLLLNVGPYQESGCNGGDFQAGLNMLSGAGPCLEVDSPYQADDSISYPPNAPVVVTAKAWKLVGAGYRATAHELCEALWNGGKGADLSVDVAADGSFENYLSGVFRDTTSTGINHMVRFVGFNAGRPDHRGFAGFNADGSFTDPEAYFILRNNWTPQWGIDGDMYIGYGVNNVAETAMVYTL